VEEVLQDVTHQLHAAEGEEEALRAKVGHMRHEADIAQTACDRARAAEAAALRVMLLHSIYIPCIPYLLACLLPRSINVQAPCKISLSCPDTLLRFPIVYFVPPQLDQAVFASSSCVV